MEYLLLGKDIFYAVQDIEDTNVRCEIYESLAKFAFEGVEPTEISKEAMLVFKLVKNRINENEIYNLFKTFGSKGGRPKKGVSKNDENLNNGVSENEKGGFQKSKRGFSELENGVLENEKGGFEKSKKGFLNSKNGVLKDENKNVILTESSSYDNINDNVTNNGDEEKTTISDKYISNIDIYNNNNNNIYTDNIITDNITEKEKEIYKEKEKEILPKSENVPFEEIKNLFNETCKSLPRIRDMSSTRKNKVRLRWNEIGKDIGVIKEIFERVQKSQYCTGNNNHGWRATFDWIFDNDRNINKILEGNYDNRINNNRRSTTEIPISQKIFNDTTIYDD